MQVSKFNAVSILKAFAFWGIFQAIFITGGFTHLFPMLPKWATGILIGSILSSLVMLITWLFLKYDDLTMHDLGLTFNSHSINKFILSLIIGIAFFGLFFLIYYWLTPITVISLDDVDVFKTIVVILLLFIALGVMEEIVFRGYFLKKLDGVIGVRGAIYVTSIAFGLYHGLTFDSITGPAVWGLLYGVLAYWSKGLAVPIGFHVGVNVTQGIFNQKVKWVDGIWSFDIVETITPLTINQVSVALQIFMLAAGIMLIEYYLRVIRPAENE